MKKRYHWIKYVLALIAHYSGYNLWQLRRKGGHYALMFHRITDCKDQLSMAIPISFAQRIAQWTQQYGRIISIQPPQDNSLSFSFSFDDGYADNEAILTAFPGLPVTVYIATSFIGTKESFWAIELQDLLLSSPDTQLDLSTFGLGVYPLHDDEQRLHALYDLNNRIKSLRPSVIADVMDAVHIQLPHHDEVKGSQFLTWDAVKRLMAHGVQFGSHTHTHIITSRISDDEFIEELNTSHQLFLENLGFVPTCFAYPNGRAEDISANSADILKRLGYQSAASTVESPNYVGVNPYRLHRFNMAKNRLMTPWGSPSRAMFTTLLVNPFKLH